MSSNAPEAIARSTRRRKSATILAVERPGSNSRPTRTPATVSGMTLEELHERVSSSRLYSDEQRHHVLSNLHAMTRNLNRLTTIGNDTKTEANLQEALRIRLSILQDNVAGFVSSDDIDRRDKYTSIEEGGACPSES